MPPDTKTNNRKTPARKTSAKTPVKAKPKAAKTNGAKAKKTAAVTVKGGAKVAKKAPAVPKRMIQEPYEWIRKQTDITSSNDLKVPDRMIDQVIGQDQAVAVAEKATQQKRNLLLIGDPGTGKSMIAQAMRQMLPAERLKDVLSYHNTEDPNQPRVATVEAGKGQEIAHEMRQLARRKVVVRKVLEWSAIAAVMILGILPMIINPWETVSIMVLGIMVLVAAFLFQLFRNTKDAALLGIPKILLEYDPKSKDHTQYVDATGSHAGALLGDVRHDPFQSGGLETPTHERVEIGAIHKAHKGILFIDEINVLRLDSQQALLTAMQDGQYAIVGQSETSSGAMVRTQPVPCDFILVAAGNLDAVQEPDGFHKGMHPALRSRIRGYGYEVYVNSTMDDNHENRLKLCRFVGQEVKKDGRIAAFDREAIAEIILEGQRRGGKRGKLTLRLRELGGLVRTAGDVAAAHNDKVVNADHVREAKRLSRSLEQQIAEQELEERRRSDHVATKEKALGLAHGSGLVGTGDVGEPAGLVVPITAAVTAPLSRHGGHIAFGGGVHDSARSQAEIVQALLKKIGGKQITDRDIHIQSVVPLDDVHADAIGLALAVSALSSLDAVAVRQDTVLIGALTVTGNVRSVKGATQAIENAVDAGFLRVIVPEADRDDIMLSPVYRKKVELVYVSDLAEVVDEIMVGAGKRALIRSLSTAGLEMVKARPVRKRA